MLHTMFRKNEIINKKIIYTNVLYIEIFHENEGLILMHLIMQSHAHHTRLLVDNTSGRLLTQ